MTLNKNIPYFDFLKGLAIIFVVGAHTVPKYDLTDISNIIPIILKDFCRCAVPLFLAISAYFMAQKNFSTKDKTIGFWRRYIPPIYIPCLIWAIAPCLASYLDWGGELYHLHLLLRCNWYYFGILIIQFYLLLPFIANRVTIRWVIIAGIVTFCCNVAIYHFQLADFIFSYGPFPAWILYYVIGIWIAKYKPVYSIKWPLIATIISLTLDCVDSLVNFGWREYLLKIHTLPLCVILTLFSKQAQQLYNSNLITNPLARLGKMSFGIYLIHYYILRHLIWTMPTDSWSIKWSITILLSIAVILCIKLIVPRKIATNLLGFR